MGWRKGKKNPGQVKRGDQDVLTESGYQRKEEVFRKISSSHSKLEQKQGREANQPKQKTGSRKLDVLSSSKKRVAKGKKREIKQQPGIHRRRRVNSQ